MGAVCTLRPSSGLRERTDKWFLKIASEMKYKRYYDVGSANRLDYWGDKEPPLLVSPRSEPPDLRNH
jgi:hypothetical protein